MKIATKTIAAAALLATLSAASLAGPTFDFEGVSDLTQVDSFYEDKGLFFSGNAYGVVAKSVGGSVNFTPSAMPSSSTAAGAFSEATDTPSFYINVQDGFSGVFSFWYTTREATGSVQLLSEYNGQGDLINSNPGDTLDLSSISQAGCTWDNDAALCEWRYVSIAFEGIAKSIVFTSSRSGGLFIDNFALGAADPGNNVPEPASLALAAVGLGAAALGRRRRKA